MRWNRQAMTDDLDELRHELRWRISCHRQIMAEGDVHGNKVCPVLLCRALDIDDSWAISLRSR
jgi:hypothetical protein